jgi:hypothetical protein
MRLLEALRIEAEGIETGIKKSRLFTQMLDRGEFREQVIAQFLRPFLPPCYGLGSGEIFSSDGQQSAQVDIVFFDSVFSTVLFQNDRKKLFPAESVFGSIEVKSRLTGPELKTACGNIASIKRLPRWRADSLDLLPHLRFGVSPPLTGGGDFRNPYLGIIFGYEGIQATSVVSQLNAEVNIDPADKQMLPDFVFVRSPGYMIVRCREDSTPVPPGQDFARFGLVQTGDDTLPLLFVTLNLCLGQMRLRGPDFDSLWRQIVQRLLTSGS